MMEYLACATVAVLLVILCRVYQFYLSYVTARAQFPGPPIKNFWTGNLNETMADNVYEKWLQWNREYGHVFQTWNGPFSRIIYIGDPEMIAKITTVNWPKSSQQYSGFRPLSGDALFVQTNHERWKTQRKQLAPAFQSGIINEQLPCFIKHLTNFTNLLDTAAERSKTVDLSALHILLTLDFIGEIAYGTELNALSQGHDCQILQIFETVLPELMKCGLFPLRGKFPILKSTRAMYRGISELRNMAEKAVQNARVRSDNDFQDGGTQKRKYRIFEILAEQREADGSYTFTSKELCDNYVAFLVAGGDPTAHAMSFLIYEVVSWPSTSHNEIRDITYLQTQLRHPEVLAKIQAEVDASIPYGAMVTSLSQVQLPYLNMVLKEILRLNSTGFGTFRTCEIDTKLFGITLPAKTTLALWNPAVHRDPRLWENPDTFDPERWRSGQPKQRGSYFPFSYGPRNCIGQGLAMFEMTLTLATVLRRYELRLEPGFSMEYLPGFTLRPKHGLPIRVARRRA